MTILYRGGHFDGDLLTSTHPAVTAAWDGCIHAIAGILLSPTAPALSDAIVWSGQNT